MKVNMWKKLGITFQKGGGLLKQLKNISKLLTQVLSPQICLELYLLVVDS